MNRYLCTLADAKQQIKTAQTGDDALILDAIEDASGRINDLFRVPFEPWHATRYFDATRNPVSYSGRVLTLTYPLLSATTITLGDGTALAGTDYQLSPRDETPASEIIIVSDFYSWYRVDNANHPLNAISITGVWGQRSQYANAWSQVTTLSAAIVSTSATSATVTSATAISPGALIRVDDEYMRVTNVSTNTLTLERGVNGTTAATHLITAPVSLYAWEPVINRAAKRLAAWLYHRRGAFENSAFDVGTGTTIQYPHDMPQEVTNILRGFVVPTSIRAVW